MWNLLKDFWLLFGRLFPFPTKPGLRPVGNPGRSSPVLVTCNFELTVRKVVQTLTRDGIDAWLLVAPTKGINVWCAAGGGHFTTDTVVSALKTSGVENRVDHRELILPQLSATGVNVWALKKRTGWEPRFGPVDIKHLAAYLGGGESSVARAYRHVRFELPDRIVMGTNLGFSSLLFLALPLLVVSIWVRGLFWISVPLVFSLAMLNSVLVFWLPGKPGVQKGFSLGLMVSAAFVVVSQAIWGLGGWQTVGWTGWIVLVATYLGYDMPGWSPLWRADVKELALGVKRTRIAIVPQRCVGCGLCRIVCPANVFARDAETEKATVVNHDACQACGACLENCPAEAIETNFRSGHCSCPACAAIHAARSFGQPADGQKEPGTETATSSHCCDSKTCAAPDAATSTVKP
ncbi:MAG: 4Fe-4S dicluster domain-containing protein [Kiritimatiellaeota bacterium]|nr:4Fe-4S dicluster domain-containing protein [Kiritimatiellota bacterium]